MKKLFIISMVALLGMFLIVTKSFAESFDPAAADEASVDAAINEDISAENDDVVPGMGVDNNDEDEDDGDEDEPMDDEDE